MSAEVTQVETTYKLAPGIVAEQRYGSGPVVITTVKIREYADDRPNFVVFEGRPLSKHGKQIGNEGWRTLTDDSAAAVMAILGAS